MPFGKLLQVEPRRALIMCSNLGFLGTKRMAVPLFEKFSERNLGAAGSVVAAPTFCMFILPCHFKDYFTHCNLPHASRESPFL
jgi:hypothetical protein